MRKREWQSRSRERAHGTPVSQSGGSAAGADGGGSLYNRSGNTEIR